MRAFIMILVALLALAPAWSENAPAAANAPQETKEQRAAREKAEKEAKAKKDAERKNLEKLLREAQQRKANKERQAKREENDCTNREKNLAWKLDRGEKQRKWKQDGFTHNIKSKEEWLGRVNRADKDNDAFLAKSEKDLKGALRRREQLKVQYENRANEKQIQNQDLAIKKQAALNDTIGILKKAIEEDEAKLEKLAKEEFQDNEKVKQDATKMTMVKAFELAKQIEQDITESYKDIKATETAIQKKMSFKAAEKITDVAKPERIEANAKDIELNPRTKEELDRQKQAQKEVVAEANVMVEATVAMMEEAMDIVMPKDDGKMEKQEKSKEIRWLEEKDFESEKLEEKIAQMEQEALFQIEMDKAAAEDDSQKAKDLAALMSTLKAMEQAKKEENQKDEAEMQKALEQAKAAKDSGNAPPELKGGENWLRPGNVAAVGGEPKDGKAIPAKWMFVTSWHVIGPFPNPNRINLRRKFAPESVIDLDATYIGDKGKQLRWQFMQAHNRDHINAWGHSEKNAAEVVPIKGEEYAIYYAYAEVFFDRECDRWVAIGSDDRSDVWVNDFHVWGSSNKLKGWVLNEDYRRIHFKKGRNKILLRCENGHWALGWSMCIALEDGKKEL